MRHGFIFSGLFFLLVCGACSFLSDHQKIEQNFAASGWTEIDKTGETVIAAHLNKDSVRVTIITSKLESERQINRRDSFMPTTCLHLTECFKVDNINVSVNGREIIFPKSILWNLSNLNRGKVVIEKEQMMLLLDGGDASSGYCLKLDFDDKRIIRKTIYDTIDMNAIEEIIYH